MIRRSFPMWASVIVLIAAVAASGWQGVAAEAPAMDHASMAVSGASGHRAPDAFLNPDGTLRLDGIGSGAINLDGWNVSLDPLRGPVFTPQSAGAAWHNLGTAAGALTRPVFAIAVSGSDVYIGGMFTSAGGVLNADRIVRWDGTRWHALGAGLNDDVFAIVVRGSNVYAGGFFTDAGGNPNADYVARWDGTQWHSLGSGVNGRVFALAVSGEDVYMSAAFSTMLAVIWMPMASRAGTGRSGTRSVRG